MSQASVLKKRHEAQGNRECLDRGAAGDGEVSALHPFPVPALWARRDSASGYIRCIPLSLIKDR